MGIGSWIKNTVSNIKQKISSSKPSTPSTPSTSSSSIGTAPSSWSSGSKGTSLSYFTGGKSGGGGSSGSSSSSGGKTSATEPIGRGGTTTIQGGSSMMRGGTYDPTTGTYTSPIGEKASMNKEVAGKLGATTLSPAAAELWNKIGSNSSGGGVYDPKYGIYIGPQGYGMSMYREEAEKRGATISSLTKEPLPETGTRTLIFESPFGGVQFVTFGAGDILAVNQEGRIRAFSKGTPLPKEYTWINEEGKQLYSVKGEGYTEEELLSMWRRGGHSDLGIMAASVVTPVNPFGFTLLSNEIGLGAYHLSKGKIGISPKEFLITSENIEKKTLTTVAGSSARSFVVKSPVVQTAAFSFFGSYAVGGILKGTGLALTTVPSIATKTVPFVASASVIATENIGTLSNVVSSIGAYTTSSAIVEKANYYVESGLTNRVGAYTSATLTTGLEVATGIKGFSVGLEKGLPIVYRGVQVGEETISQGIYNQWTGNPIYTRTATGVDASGSLVFTKGWGMPEKVAYPLLRTSAYTPSGAVETALYMQYVRTNMVQGIDVESAYSVAKFTYGTKSNIYNKEYLNTFFKEAGFKEETAKALEKYFTKQKGYEIYGSTPTGAQVQGYRTSKDLDVVFYYKSGTTKAQEITNIINRYEGFGTAEVQGTGQIFVKGIKKFDIHGIDNPAEFTAVNQPFGFTKLKPIKIKSIPTSQVSQEGVNKLASVGSLQPSGIISPDMLKRSKDIADFYVIQKELIQVKGGKGSITTAVYNTIYKEKAMTYFGEDVFLKNYPTLLARNYYVPSTSIISSSKTTTGLIISPSTLKSSKSPSVSSLSSVSFTTYPSVSGKPSESSKPSTSSISASISSSISRSNSQSPSSSIPSPSPSYSFSPSPPSPSPSKSQFSSKSYSFSPSPFPSLPLPSFAGLPSFKFGAGSSVSVGNVGGFKLAKYTPSYTAFVKGIKGSIAKPTKIGYTGLEIRPIPRQYSPKKLISIK